MSDQNHAQHSYEMTVYRSDSRLPSTAKAEDEAQQIVRQVKDSPNLLKVFSQVYWDNRRHEHRMVRINNDTVEEAFRVVLQTRLEGLKGECQYWLTEKRVRLGSRLNRVIRQFLMDEQKHLESAWDDYARTFIPDIRRDYELMEQNRDLPRLAQTIEIRIERKLDAFLMFEQKLRDSLRRQVDKILSQEI